MAGNETLTQRIKAEFDASAGRARATEQEKAKQRQEHEARLAKFNAVCDELKAVWGPRLDEFIKQFGDKVKATPNLSPSLREARVDFMTELANVTVTLSAAPSPDVQKIVLEYDLLILPMFFEYERHAKLEMPLDKIDKDAIGRWIDDKLVACVKAYLSLSENEYYLRRALVEDPISKKRILPEHACAKLEHAGKTYHFETEETFQKFREQNGLAAGSALAEPKPASLPGRDAGSSGGAKPGTPPKTAPAPAAQVAKK